MTRPNRTRPHGMLFHETTHRYTLDGKPVPGVTTILGVLDKRGIPKWAARQVAEHVADHPDAIEHLRAIGRDALVDALKGVPWGTRDRAATRGRVLHAHAEALLHGDEITVEDEHVPVIESALDFLDDWHIDPILAEVPVASRTHWYAGTLDLIARYKRPDTGHEGTGIFDYKSGKAIYPEYAMQLAAYAGAEFHGLHGEEEPLPAVDAAFGVHIRDDGYDVHELRCGPDIHAEFLAIRAVYDITKRMRGDWRTPGSGYAGLPIRAHEENVA